MVGDVARIPYCRPRRLSSHAKGVGDDPPSSPGLAMAFRCTAASPRDSRSKQQDEKIEEPNNGRVGGCGPPANPPPSA